ncbi:cytosine/adenosine deaminase-related metal-dependent hydrolase [Microvirga flocculans]|uniref:Cytosine/adenosine deaminase-related metal-dependent hydrolase n=1 Tax=Microvirga flocculans TaxID=217168 RepID=A0A7W6IIM6_9HYPH|nr:amidohydrolase family protein [Microvirga flocculans]MBB4042162.1 cytosine/adenosine deaminase-related metal-dependent hydrolase [Microvirga flocculans]
MTEQKPKTTVFRSCDWLVAWDAVARSHVYLRNADFAIRGKEIIQVGGHFTDAADVEIDARRMMLIPGFVDVHSHPGHEPGWKGMLEELGSPRLGQSSLYEFMPLFQIGTEYTRPSLRVAVSELLKSGVTTICDLGRPRDTWADEYAETGIRAVLWGMFRSGPWKTRNGHSVEYDLDPATGDRLLREAIDIADAASRHESGRITGYFGPSQIDTCTEGQIREALQAARDRNQPIQIHAAQSVVEFQEIMRRYGCTPMEWLDKIGALGPDTIIGHGIFLNDHPWLHWPHANDFERLRDSGAQVAHCPVVFARRGIALNTLSRYMDAGIRCGIGTDSFPHNMLDELRMACYAGRIVAGSFKAASTTHAFMAATAVGADMIRRPDLGRLAPGCKADFSVVDMTNPYMQPDYEPIRSLVYSANDRAIKDVYVDGRQVVRNGEVLDFDITDDVEMLRKAQAEAIAAAPQRDWAGRSLDQLAPRVFPLRS